MTVKKLTVEEQYKKYPPVWPRFVISALVVFAIVLLSNYSIDVKGINPKGVLIAKAALKGLISPSWALITDTSTSGLMYMLMETLAIGLLGTVFGIILALPLAFLASRNVCPRWINTIALAVISVIRAFPAFMYGIMFVKAVGPGAFAGVLSMTISSVGMLSKLLVEAIEDLNPGIIEALDASGCSSFEKIRYGIIPQLSSNIVSILIYRLDINVKNASILGVVGAGGIGAPLIFSIAKQSWHEVSAMLLGLIILVLVLEYFSTRLRRKLSVGQ
ncbi:MAG: phosphonate ABC transporter, permease protein PhnE [Erysipelotrichaceae bacterium]|nr:phosphonate ABC transporter, permease protein PhnE [Erysipelotrichaceae bacterium]